VERFLVAGILIAVAAIVAVVLGRRRPAPPTQAPVEVPAQLDRNDFDEPAKPWLVVVWTSETCDSCERTTTKAGLLASPQVAYQVVPWQERRDLHDRYRIDTVPILVLADAQGVVKVSFVGTPNFTDLVGAVAEAREPGSTPTHEPGARDHSLRGVGA